jgi:hypothetical protein
MAADAGELRARATLDNTEFLSALKDMVNGVQSSTQEATDQISKMAEGFTAMAEAAAAVEIADKIKDFATECIDAAAQVGKLQASFEALNGATEQTSELFEKLEGMSLSSTFSFADTLGPAAQNMLKLGVSAEQTGETMQALVDAASGLKQGPNWINNVSGSIDSMNARLVANTRDMKAFEQEGVDAWGALADQLGVSVATAQDMIKKGEVTAAQVTQAITDQMAQQFQGASDLASTTWLGAMGILSNSAEKAEESIGGTLLKTLNDFAPVLTTIAGLLQQFATWWSNLPAPITNAITALGAAAVIVGTIAAALPLLGTALEAVIAIFAGAAGPITLAVAALALIGKWVYDEWPAIKAVFLQLWDDIVAGWQALWSTVGPWFQSIFGGVATAVTGIWGGIKSVVGGVIDWAVGAFNTFMSAIGGVLASLGNLVSSIPGVSNTVNSLTAAWQSGQKAIAAAQAATDAHTAAIKANMSASAQATQARKQQEAADLAQSNTEKAAAAQAQKDATEAAKAAAEALAYNEALKKTYDALYAVAPDVAAQFNSMYGGMEQSATDAQKLMGKFWGDIDAAEQQVIITTVQLGNAYKALGMTGDQGLEGQAQKASAAFDLLQASGTASAGALSKAFDVVVADQQKVVDQMNTSVKDAYAQGLIDADTYYDDVTKTAQQHYDDVAAMVAQGLATQTDAAAAYQVLLNARKAADQNAVAEYTAGVNAIGEQTQEQLDKASQQWGAYANMIGEKLGTESKAYIEASIKAVQDMIAEESALGDTSAVEKLNAQLKALQDQLEAGKPPADQLTDAMKTLGATSIQSLTTQINAAADALVKVQALQQQGVATSADVAAAQKTLFNLVGQEITQYNDQYTPAIQKNDRSAQTAAQNNLKSATAVQQALTQTGNSAQASAAIQVAAAQQSADAYTKLQVAALKTVEDAYKTLGMTVTQQLQDSAAKSQAAYDAIAASGTASAVQLQEAWVKNQQTQLATTLQLGGQVTEDQKNQLAQQEQDLKNHLDITTSQWQTAYDGIHSAVSTTFSDLAKTIVTGDGSFSDIMTKMWQSIAESALNAFIAPVTKAIENFISTTIANLLSGQGLGGILDSLKAIGSAASGIFGSGGTLATSASTMGQVGQAAGMGGSAASAAGSGASAAGSVASSLTGILSAIGSIGSFITGGIGDIQNVHIENILGEIEQNTRYTSLLMGMQADGGALAVLWKIDNELAFGNLVKATENLRDLFKDWSGPVLADLNGILAMWVGTAPYIVDTKTVLEDIRGIASDIRDQIVSGFQQLTVTINAGNLTTAEAARQLGNQIASNLTTQLVGVPR